MKKEVSPMVMGVILSVVLIVVIVIAYRTFTVSQKTETKGSEEYMDKVKRGEPMYTPPAGVVPGSPGGGPPSGAPGGAAGSYNLRPPSK